MSIRDIYIRLHTYDFVCSAEEQTRLATVWAKATAAKVSSGTPNQHTAWARCVILVC